MASPDAGTTAGASVLRLHAWSLRLQPAHHNANYWCFRVAHDLIKLDVAYAVLTLCHVLTALWSGTSAPRWCLLGLLVPACLQLLAMRCWRHKYADLRLGMALTLRTAWLAFGTLALPPPRTAPLPALPLLVACSSRLAHFALQPFMQPLPLKVQLPLQLAGMALLLHDYRSMLLYCLDNVPQVARALYRAHAFLEGMFHVTTVFMFVTPGVLARCGLHDLAAVMLFVLAYFGLALPLVLAYKQELLSKAAYVVRHSCRSPGGGAASSANPRDSSSGSSSSSITAADRQDSSSNLSGSGEALAPQVWLVGRGPLIPQDVLVRMLCSPAERLKDDVVWGALLMFVTWGCCSWAVASL